jgi:WD40 repeat protein
MHTHLVKHGVKIVFAGLVCLAARTAEPLFNNTDNANMNGIVAKITMELPDKDETSLSSLAFSADGEYLAVRSRNNAINVWRWKTKSIVARLEVPGRANDFLSSTALAFSPKGNLLMSCHDPAPDHSSVTVWDTRAWKVVQSIGTEKDGGGCTAADFTFDGRHLVRLTQKSRTQPGNTIEVYRTDTWRLVAGVRTFPWYVTNLAMPGSGSNIAVAGRMGEVSKEFSSETSGFQTLVAPKRSVLAVMDLETLNVGSSHPLAATATPFGSLTWSADGGLISYAAGHGIEVFSVRNGERSLHVPVLAASAHQTIAYTANGRFLIEAHGANVSELQIWDRTRARKLQSIKGEFCKIAVSPNGSHVAAATLGKTVVWDLL